MQKFFSKISNLPVISFQAEGRVAVCKEVLFDTKELVVSLLLVQSSSLFKKVKHYIVWNDILEISNGIYIQDVDSLTDESELLRHKDVIERRIVIVKMSVQTESGQKFGSVYDYTIDMETGTLIRIYVDGGGFFTAKKLIIGRNQIVELRENTIVVEDSVLKEMESEKILKKAGELRAKVSLSIKDDKIHN